MPRVVLATIVLAVSLGAPLAAYACSCAAPATVEEALERASAAFSGQVTQVRRPLLDRLGVTDSGEHEVSFRVIRIWKGVTTSEVVVRTRLTGEACGYPFVRGGAYVVFVHEVMPGIETGICTGTQDLSDADEVVRALESAMQ
jgi:hypothetical protein